jgi:4-amino-4-deoxy-L-arabinose transferase-like glycosyltransferase
VPAPIAAPALARPNAAATVAPVLLVILAATLARVALGAVLPLGIDEAYMVAAGRHVALSYYDHPPISWWLSHGAALLFGTEAPLAVRAPFILLGAVSLLLMYRLATPDFGPRAGFWAVLAMALAPVLSLSGGSWVLPDGPMLCFLLAAALCLRRALNGHGLSWWLGAGIWAGLALLSKYLSILPLAGAAVALLSVPSWRRHLLHAGPWLAVLVALLCFAPVILWNATHGWASIAFQGGRAAAVALHPFAPFMVLAGEALFLLPWIWAPAMLAFWRALRPGPRPTPEWLLACLAAPAIVLFVVVSLWSPRILFHWAAPGYLFLFPLLGQFLASWEESGTRVLRQTTIGTACFLLLAMTILGAQSLWGWSGLLAPGAVAQMISWDELGPALADHGWLPPNTLLAATRWMDCGKLGAALPEHPLVCLTDDPREFAYAAPDSRFAGRPVLILAPRTDAADLTRELAPSVATLTQLGTIPLADHGRVLMQIPVWRGTLR